MPKRAVIIVAGGTGTRMNSKIAKQFYGDAGAWKKIFDANKDKINDPDLIYPGQPIIIP